MSVCFLDFFDAHPFGEAGQNEGDREPGSPNREFTAQKLRIGHDPARGLEWLQSTVFHVVHLAFIITHVLPITERQFGLNPASFDEIQQVKSQCKALRSVAGGLFACGYREIEDRAKRLDDAN